MSNIYQNLVPAAPASIYAFFDKVQVWLKKTLSRSTISNLGQQSGHVFCDNRAARFGQGYRQRLEMKQPNPEVLRRLAHREDALVNRVEVALDFVFDNINERDLALEFLHRHMVRRWHGRKQKIKIISSRVGSGQCSGPKPEVISEIEGAATRYDAGRAPNALVLYPAAYSRVTGEEHCLHLEWRLNGKRAVQAAGIISPASLLDFDHRAFWEKHLLLVEIDPERLGRLIRNKANGTRSRTPDMDVWCGRTVNLDRKRGGVVLKAHGSMQEVIDEFGSSFGLRRWLAPIPCDGFLP